MASYRGSEDLWGLGGGERGAPCGTPECCLVEGRRVQAWRWHDGARGGPLGVCSAEEVKQRRRGECSSARRVVAAWQGSSGRVAAASSGRMRGTPGEVKG